MNDLNCSARKLLLARIGGKWSEGVITDQISHSER